MHKGIKDIKGLQKEYILKRLTPLDRITNNIMEQKPNDLSGDLWTSYLDVCAKTNEKPIARRTFSAYLQKLESLLSNSSEKPSVTRKVRSFRAVWRF